MLLIKVISFTMEVLLKTNNMKISEVIKRLQEIQEKHGDLFVRVAVGEYDIPLKRMDFNVYGDSLYIE